jgi:hypothetical protein
MPDFGNENVMSYAEAFSETIALKLKQFRRFNPKTSTIRPDCDVLILDKHGVRSD